MIPRWRRSWGDQNEDLPVDVMPASNGEYIPPPPTAEQLAIMRLADAETERWRRRFGMSRRTFVRTAAATAIGFWAIDMIGNTRWGNYGYAHNTATTDACDLEWAGRGGLETLDNLEGEFIFDVQSHHVEPDGLWRVTNPAIEAFFAALWPQAGPLGGRPGVRDDGSVKGFGAGEVDPIANLSRFHYLKELFLDSATTMTVLSAVPTAPDRDQPLPISEAATTVHTVNDLAKSQRTVMHAFVMPNRGSAGQTQSGSGLRPVFLDEELALMMERAELYQGILRGWKTYCPWGDVPYASGWFLDDQEMGLPFIDQVRKVSQRYPAIPPVIATHKGFALPGFDQRSAAPRDVGPAASQNPDVRFLVYHSGHDILEPPQGPYPGDAAVDSSNRSVDSFVKALRENDWDASHFVEPGKTFGNVPNVWAELGSVWRDYMSDPSSCAHLLGKLITHVGPKRVAWGTDSLWYGSPQKEIVALRRFEFSDEAKRLYNLPYGLEGDVEDPTQPAPTKARTIRNGILGRNAAEAYNIDPDAVRNKINCDDVQGLHDTYVTDAGTPKESAPLRTNAIIGPRSRRELFAMIKEKPWGP
jgi:predicted TIM-barrel fold metal-dependent hydrolase